MRRGHGRCVICTANSDEFPTFEPESYLSSRFAIARLFITSDSLVRSRSRAVNYPKRKASASAIDDSKSVGTFSSPSSVDPNAKRTLSERDLSPPIYGPDFSSVSPQRGGQKEKGIKRKANERNGQGERYMFRRRGLPATRVGDAAFCFLLTASSFFAFYPLSLGVDAIRKMMRRRNSIPRIRCLAPARRPVIAAARRTAMHHAVMNELGITLRRYASPHLCRFFRPPSFSLSLLVIRYANVLSPTYVSIRSSKRH